MDGSTATGTAQARWGAPTLNGRHVPKGYDEVDGTRRENGAETGLPDSAKIGLADTVFLEFGVKR